jgi:uncharacterized membrane protein
VEATADHVVARVPPALVMIVLVMIVPEMIGAMTALATTTKGAAEELLHKVDVAAAAAVAEPLLGKT